MSDLLWDNVAPACDKQLFNDELSTTGKSQPNQLFQTHAMEDSELEQLPRAVWVGISQLVGVTECCSMTKCCTWLHGAFQVQAIWQSQALHCRYCVQTDTQWLCETAPKACQLTQNIDWRLLVYLNVAFPRQCVSVRVGAFDLRLPLSDSSHGASFHELMSMLAEILAPLAQTDPSKPWHMRLRWLQWCGRPGLLVKEYLLGEISDRNLAKQVLRPGSKLLLEWADPSDNSWPVPPLHNHSSDFRGLGQFLWHWPEVGPEASSGYPITSPVGVKTPQDAVLVRIISSWLQKERWVLLEEPSLSELLDKIRAVLTLEDHRLQQRSLRFRLVEMSQPTDVDSEQLKHLAWAQSETVYVEEFQPSASEGPALRSSQELIFSLRREQAFSHLLRSCEEELGVDDDRETTGRWNRTVTEPVRQVTADAASWNAEIFAPQIAVRQFSEPPSQQVRSQQSHSSPGPDVAGVSEAAPSPATSTGCVIERMVPHYPPVRVLGTQKTRQFEFHPLLEDLALVGDKLGAAQIVKTDGSQMPEDHPALQVDACPLLSLSWLKHNPNVALCGAANTGAIRFLRYMPEARPGEPLLATLNRFKSFPKLSSLSVNCSDNFLLASGISSSIVVYDLETGHVVCNGNRVHEHFINISRFCQTSPHIFATASFDYTCKIWDLRQPLGANKAVKTLNTGGHNVMCQFSPDDRHFLCSGIDTQLVQFEVPSWRQTPLQMPLRPSVHPDRYRRSAYLASSQHFVTAATEESHIHVMTTQGEKLGAIDFRSTFEDFSSPQELSRDKLLSGTVTLDDAEPMSGSSRNNHAFVQSIRTHPVVSNRLGVLMAKTKGSASPSDSYIAVLDLDRREMMSR